MVSGLGSSAAVNTLPLVAAALVAAEVLHSIDFIKQPR